MTIIVKDSGAVAQLRKAKKLLRLALENLDFENNASEVASLKYDIEKFLKKGKKK
jgi:hypothetical protein